MVNNPTVTLFLWFIFEIDVLSFKSFTAHNAHNETRQGCMHALVPSALQAYGLVMSRGCMILTITNEHQSYCRVAAHYRLPLFPRLYHLISASPISLVPPYHVGQPSVWCFDSRPWAQLDLTPVLVKPHLIEQGDP